MKATTTSAIVLAGGLGTRLRSAVPDLPKPMAPVAGRPFLAHLLDRWIDQGITHFVLSVGYRHEVIRAYFGGTYGGATLDYAVEATPQGTGGGLLLAAQHLPADAPFLLLNGDTFFDVPLSQLTELAASQQTDWCFALFRTSEPGRYMGMEIAQDSRITNLRTGMEQPERLANGGVYIVHPRSLSGLAAQPDTPLSLENDLFPRLLAAGQRWFGLECPGAFIDIGIPQDFHRAASVLPVHTAQRTEDALHH
ncbi:NTP transferase domain-containing protein [Sphaerotilus montanus]|uniref:D-glycero-alpha-D-manno-heptose 1-phosphate guanylyltransferase n=1 Tax=Sphaerotilus montanus TaxID=522889 RepID=A0A7Y9QXP3_9BURK|nr:nucleotidyltransferase family protein [Sphaerotilus montanus]NYG33378.1 D-glycero-alpha-D-manno-heptose 1-phosphate guanylyltransferase [Sphaerotilus montanus]NZD56988.1 NTP transferase domain-containing protein [Sphaerotilus montanus]